MFVNQHKKGILLCLIYAGLINICTAFFGNDGRFLMKNHFPDRRTSILCGRRWKDCWTARRNLEGP